MPEEPKKPDPTNAVEFELWKLDIKEYREQKTAYTDFKSAIYHLVLGQSAEALKDHLKSHVKFQPPTKTVLPSCRLLERSPSISNNPADELCQAEETFFSLKQQQGESLRDYHDKFYNHVEVMT